MLFVFAEINNESLSIVFEIPVFNFFQQLQKKILDVKFYVIFDAKRNETIEQKLL